MRQLITIGFIATLFLSPAVAGAQSSQKAVAKPQLLATANASAKPALKAPAKKAAVKKAPAKKATAKTTKKKVVKKTVTCARCKSLAEGADRSAAAKAKSWTGTVIGINEGEHSYVITEATALNRIKAYPQRSVIVSNATQITASGEQRDFSGIDVGYRIKVTGAYNANKRIIQADTISVVSAPLVPVTTGR